MTNSADPDNLIYLEANWSGSTLFAKAGHIWAQQDQGLDFLLFVTLYFVSSISENIWARVLVLGRLIGAEQ